jgi:hypothetical protein
MESYLIEELGRNEPLDLSKPKVKTLVYRLASSTSVGECCTGIILACPSGTGTGSFNEPLCILDSMKRFRSNFLLK